MVLTEAYCEKQMQTSIEGLFENYKMMISRQLERVDLSISELLELLEEDEYRFTLKAHSLIEHFIGSLAQVNGVDKTIKNFPNSGMKVRLDALLKAKVIPQLGYDFIRSLSFIRNKYAHDPRFMNSSVVQCINALDVEAKKQLMSAVVGLILIIYPVRSFDEVRKEIMELDESEKPEYFEVQEFAVIYFKGMVVLSIYALVVSSSPKEEQEASIPLWLELAQVAISLMETFSISTFGISYSQLEASMSEPS
ncbi:hypothetical protein [Pseudodesulfovibrio sp. zrk46]|uniref:hypothetical protein n=1 Tax=Pseudodesulfovibrio sp. zrk46 TaxID=2725288 RepID=UPI001448C846|nr:hypothetical protein [Pseudodesulfovibrio sp. zrk46]QJB56544.1 hypothetical protein HFN16_09035 [Pseudodesulfovibrio sp. zrk46]